jgi:hypothetical protein
MNPQLSQDYNVDSRYATVRKAVDNTSGTRFLNDYLENRREFLKVPKDRSQEDRFTIAGPGDSIYSFRNSFRASK